MFFKPNAVASEAKHRLHRFGDKSPEDQPRAGQTSGAMRVRINRVLSASERTHEAQIDRLLRE